VKPTLFAAASAFALALPGAALTQHEQHQGHSMPMPMPEQQPQQVVEIDDGHHGEGQKVGKVSLGLEPIYGGDPNGAMAFVRLKLD
jgi:hypothetical protein